MKQIVAAENVIPIVNGCVFLLIILGFACMYSRGRVGLEPQRGSSCRRRSARVRMLLALQSLTANQLRSLAAEIVLPLASSGHGGAAPPRAEFATSVALPFVRGRPFAQPGQGDPDVRSRRRKRLRALAVAADGWQAFEQVPFIPIGQWFHPTAFRNIVTDVGRQGTHADPPPAGMARSSLRLSNGG